MKIAPAIQPYVAAARPGLEFAAAPAGSAAVQGVPATFGGGLPGRLSIDGGTLERAFDQVVDVMESSESVHGGFRQAAPGLIGGCLGFGYQAVKLTEAVRDRDSPAAWRAGAGAVVHFMQFAAHVVGPAHPGAHALLVGVAENTGRALAQLPPSRE